VHPVVFVLPTPWGEVLFYAYGLALGAGLVGAWYLARRTAARLGEDAERVGGPFVAAALSAIAAGWLGRGLLAAVDGGAGAFGFDGAALSGPFALAGALGGAALAARRAGRSAGRTLDALAPCLALAFAADALGHYLHGTGFGALLPEGAPAWLERLGTFPRWSLPGDRLGSPAYLDHLQRFAERMDPDVDASLPVHPVQLYALALGGAVAATASLRARPSLAAGALAPAVAAALAAGELLLDRLRAHATERASTWALVAVLACSALAFARITRRSRAAARGA
jgi:phosphatidylglycerol:prolipoprotein diacylglycerol transferase